MSLFRSLDNLKEQEPEVLAPASFKTVEGSIDDFIHKMEKIDNIPNNEIQEIIYRQVNMFLNYDLFLSSNKTREFAQWLFTNKKFLSNLITCVPHMSLSNHQIICCNKLAYDYISISTEEKDSEVRDMLLELSYRVNYKTVMSLAGIIGMEPAKQLAMFRNSSFKENINAKRVNIYLIKSGLDLNEQMMIDIYAKLFSSVSTLFSTTMCEMPEQNYTEEEMYRYNEMSKAMVDILDNMTSIEIQKTLQNYVSVYFLMGKPKVRFSLKEYTNSNNYKRILEIIKDLEFDEIYVP